MFDFIEKAARLVTDVATLPVSVAADAVTLGGELVDREEAYTHTKGKRILANAKDLIDDIAS